MKHNRLFSLALVGSFLLFAASCEKEVISNEDLYRPAGSPIVFSAATGYQNGVATKAEYSGVLYGGALSSSTPTYERIDWVNNDPIKIVYNSTPASYTIKGSTITNNNTQNSYAELNGSALFWDGSGNHKFYALYPAGGTANGTLSDQGVVSGTIPATQDVTSKVIAATDATYNKFQPDTEHYGYLVACEEITGDSNASSVDLHFKPAVTTFEFKLSHNSSTDPDPTIMSVDLETETVGSSRSPLTGAFSFPILGRDNSDSNNLGAYWNKSTTGTNPTVITSPGYKITVGFGTNGFKMSSNNGYLDFSILALPVDITGLKLTVHFADGVKVIRFKDNRGTPSESWHTFSAAKKYIITNYAPTGEWEYVIEDIADQTFVGHEEILSIGYNVKSYKYNKLDNSIKAIVPWKMQYSLDDGTTWTDVPSTGVISGSDYSINNAAVTGVGSYTTGEDRSAKLNGESIPSGDTEHSPATIIADLQSRTAKGDASSPYDLSMHDIYGNSHSQTTANSYIVTAPGTYKFPVVYGNAITNGDTDYTEAFWPASRGGSGEGSASQISSVYFNHASTNTFRYIARFIRADGQFMTVARIDQDMAPISSPNAAIVWQNRMELTPGEGAGPIVQESSVSYDNGYITFTVRPQDIRPGNVVIAFRGGTSLLPANTILWSWQIWICPDDLTPVQFSNGALLPYNLGYIDSTGAGIQNYPNRLIKYRIVQVENGVQHDTEDFTLEQIGDGRAWDASVGFNVYYQWGRKDPMIPAMDYNYTTMTPPSPATGTRDVYPDADFYPGTGYTIDVSGSPVAGGVTAHISYPNGNYDYVSGITQPYKAFINQQSTGWVGGYINGNINGNTTNSSQIDRQFSSIACNLWNNGMYTTMDGTNAMWKTVYDPCPPGFCVPTAGVLGNLTASNLVARTTDGAYFAAPSGTRLFMPYSGLRVYYANAVTGTYLLWAEEVRRSGWYWTDTNNADVTTTTINLPESCQYARCFSVSQSTINTTIPVANSQLYTRGSSLAIRPMVDPKYQ